MNKPLPTREQVAIAAVMMAIMAVGFSCLCGTAARSALYAHPIDWGDYIAFGVSLVGAVGCCVVTIILFTGLCNYDSLEERRRE